MRLSTVEWRKIEFRNIEWRKIVDKHFQISDRGSSVNLELFSGYVQFISCLYVLAVIPDQMPAAGFSVCLEYVFTLVSFLNLQNFLYSHQQRASVEATCLACAVGSILSGLWTNLPFVIAPPTAVSIYLGKPHKKTQFSRSLLIHYLCDEIVVAMQQNNMSIAEGKSAIIMSGIALVLVGAIKPLSSFVSKLIPACLQAATAIG